MMKLLLINPSNPIVSMNSGRASRWNKYRVWKPLSLMVIAGLTPKDWDITIIDENHGLPDYDAMPRPDLVGITAFTSQASRAYELAAQFRALGIPVVMGGIHGNPVDPGSEFPLSTIPAQVPEDPDEDLLGHVLTVLSRDPQKPEHAEYPLLVPLEKRVERAHLPGPRRLDQRFVGRVAICRGRHPLRTPAVNQKGLWLPRTSTASTE